MRSPLLSAFLATATPSEQAILLDARDGYAPALPDGDIDPTWDNLAAPDTLDTTGGW